MDRNSPNVIFKSKFCLALNCRDNYKKNNYYKKERLKDIDNMVDYYSNEKKKMISMFEYYMGHTRSENYNLVLESGQYATKKDIIKIKADYKKYIENSNLWKGILSFKKEYIDENIDMKTLEQKMAKEILPQFLKYCGFKNIKNMSYIFSIHTNRKHQPHIHFAFIEKKPNYSYCDKKINYRIKGKISLDEQEYLKRLVDLSIQSEKYYSPLLKKTNEDIDYLKSFFNSKEKNYMLDNIDELYAEENIIRLGELLYQYRKLNKLQACRVKYNSIKNTELGSEIRRLTKKVKRQLFNNKTSTLYTARKEISNDINRLNKYFNTLNNNNNIIDKIKNNSIADKKENYIDNYIYNVIVNHALYQYNHFSTLIKMKYDKQNISVEELIQEISYQNNMIKENNDYLIRKTVLVNYFRGNSNITKFPNKHKMEKSLKNINYEMNLAIEKFNKLFKYNDKEKN